MNLHFYFNNFIAETKSTRNLSDKSIKAYKSDISNFINFIDNNNLKIIQPNSLIIYIEYLNNVKKLKDSTIHRKIISLKLFINFLYHNQIIKSNPFSKTKFKFKKEYKLPKTLSINEVKELIKTITNINSESNFKKFETIRDLAIIDLLISTGIRIGELSYMKLDDLNLYDRTILIHGKGRKQRLIFLSSNDTINNLNNWINIRNKHPHFVNNIFINRYGNSLSIHGIEDIYYKYRDLAKINPSSTPHYLRHTFATNLLSNGADIRSVQEILGHSSISTTEIYTEVSINRKQEVLTKYNYRNFLS